MKLIMAQLNPTIGDLKGNTIKILETLDRARAEGGDLVVFPELSICGYPPEDLLYHDAFLDAMEEKLEEIVKASKGLMIFVGCARRNLGSGDKPLLNSAAVIHDGVLLGFQDKWLLPTYDVFDERRYFAPGQGTRVWPYLGKKIGVVICEDIWQHAGYVGASRYPRDPILELRAHQPDLLLNLSASPYQFGKPDLRIEVCEKASQTLKCPVALCCQVGGNGALIFDGMSVFVGASGKVCRLGKAFEEDFIQIDLAASSECHLPNMDSLEHLYQALCLGVKDYFRKCGFKKACLGLSGGIDSALVAAIAKEALGGENVLGVAMPSMHTKESSLNDAKELAKNLGIQYLEIPIKETYDHYTQLLAPYFEEKPLDITEENLQSRIRGMILMAFSNKLGYIVLSTGNKSEIAVGYTTLYGDMCGGLGVISDVFKTKVYDLCRFLNRHEQVIPQSIIDKPPSAELRPNQMDLDSLPEYGIVDTVLEEYVENSLDPEEIVAKYGFPQEVVLDLIRKVHRAEYKRRQGAPVIRVSKKSFGVGRHFPLVQGWVT